jgi:hypothetical protein
MTWYRQIVAFASFHTFLAAELLWEDPFEQKNLQEYFAKEQL